VVYSLLCDMNFVVVVCIVLIGLVCNPNYSLLLQLSTEKQHHSWLLYLQQSLFVHVRLSLTTTYNNFCNTYFNKYNYLFITYELNDLVPLSVGDALVQLLLQKSVEI
jgi:hypothetical protein